MLAETWCAVISPLVRWTPKRCYVRFEKERKAHGINDVLSYRDVLSDREPISKNIGHNGASVLRGALAGWHADPSNLWATLVKLGDLKGFHNLGNARGLCRLLKLLVIEFPSRIRQASLTKKVSTITKLWALETQLAWGNFSMKGWNRTQATSHFKSRGSGSLNEV